MRLRTLHRALLGFAFGPLLSCGGDTSPRKGQIMLALQTDMNIPTDVSHVRIVVLKNGALKFDQKYRVGKDGEEIPATLGIIASDNASDTTEVRVLSYQGSKVRTLNRVVTTIPTNRVATLNVPIQWLCDGQVKSSEAAADGFDSSCDDPEAACIAGECRKVYVDSLTLPDFELADVTGGSAVPEEGLCYDTAACLDLGRDITPDQQCQISVPKKLLPKLNVGLRLPKDHGGICGAAGNCYIPLDSHPDSGFRVVDGARDPAIVALPKAACSKLASGDAAAVRVSDACVTKTPSIPTCGPWTSVGTRNPNKGPTGGTGAAPGVDPDLGGAGGAGGDNGGTVEPRSCSGFFASNPEPISDDPEVDQLARLVLDLEQQVRQVRRSVGEACARTKDRLSAETTVLSSVELSDLEIDDQCSAAKQLLIDIPATWKVVGSGQNCRANVVEQLALEKECLRSEGCELPDPAERCDYPLGTCDATCTGECLPGDTMLNVACTGLCQGQCVGTCEGKCLGPGGNSLPSDDCMGWCEGTCTGSCQGACSSVSTCAGLCRGECSGGMSEYYCDGPLLLPDCAISSGCENLAAATAAVHRVCAAGSVFVSGPTPPEVAPAIADNLPALLVSAARASGLTLAAAHMEGATAALSSQPQSGEARACLDVALTRLPRALTSLEFAVNAANSVAWEMTREPDPAAVCEGNSFDDSCATCVKSLCCDALTACTQISGCFEAANCVRPCLAQGGTQATCASQCQLDTTLFSTVESFIECQSTECQASCVGPTANSGACVASGSATYLVDDFEDQNTAAPSGNWHITNPDEFLGSITLNQPGALDSAFALGIAGSPDPGLSIDFNGCMDARGTSALSFQATSPDATTSTVMVTLRVRTRPNELQSRGGACSGSQCGDYHLFTTTVPARAFGFKSVPWSWFLDSGAHPPDLSQIIGIDFVLYGSQAQQIVIDDVKFEGPNL